MCKVSCALSLILILFFVFCCHVQSEFETQPKILTEDGTMLLEAAPDRNITFRVSRDATLMVNDFDVLAEMRKYKKAQQLDEQQESYSLDTITEQVSAFKRDFSRLIRRLTNLQNRTRGAGPRVNTIRQHLLRLTRVSRSVTRITAKLTKGQCKGDPCKNGGTCHDGYDASTCECAAGWSGATCEEDVNECVMLAGTDLMGCLNNGQCINTPGSYRCNCQHGFTGTHCRLRKAVCLTEQSHELCGHGSCVPASNAQGYVCICEQGWQKANATAACTLDVDECEPAKNPCHDVCINLPGSFKCGACPLGYTGDGKYCRDVDECAVGNGGCSLQPKVRCINTEGSYHCGRCPIGWTGDGHSCEQAPSNSCDDTHICHPRAKCEYVSETMVCTCPLGMFGHGYGADGCSLTVSYDPCEQHKCANNATCITTGRGTSCVCQEGFTGPLCAETDACHAHACQNGATCQLLPGNKHKCTCANGYSGANCEHLRTYCGAILRAATGTLHFPPNAGPYEPQERCAFLISTTRNEILNVTFSAFQLEESLDCSKDFLQIHDGSSLAAQLIGRFCGQTLPHGDGNIISTHNQMFFWFRSDNETQAGGFNMSWQSMPYICGDDIVLTSSAQSDVIRSPGYPGKTAASRDCVWELEAPFGHRLLLHFYEITLGGSGSRATGNNSSDCQWDTFTVHDSDRMLLQACRSLQPAPLHSSSNELTIRYHTDAHSADSAFQLHYEVVAGTPGCGGIYTEPSGAVSGYINAPVCLYLIQQPSGMRIRVTFGQLRLFVAENCSLQRIDIFDGATAEDTLLKRICRLEDDVSFESSGNQLLLRYEYGILGFDLPSIQYSFTYERVCEHQYDDVDGGIFTTPNYPNGYLEHTTCSYVLYAPLDHVIRLNITDLSFSSTVPNMLDDHNAAMQLTKPEDLNYLDVIADDGDQRLYKSVTNMEVVSTSNSIKLNFHGSRNRMKGRGMRVEYSFERLTCGGLLRPTPEAVVVTKAFVSIDYCQWFIRMQDENKGIELDALFVAFADRTAAVSIYDNSTGSNGNLLDKLDKDRDKLLKTYNSNFLSIVFQRNSNLRTYIYTTFSYKVVDTSQMCGGVVGGNVGHIATPNYPKDYPKKRDCNWVIKAPLNHKIELIVRSFKLETTSSNQCFEDYVEIRNGDTPLSPLIGRYCGTQIPSRIPSFGNRLYISFHSDESIQDSGFYMDWKQTNTGCGGKLTSYTGSIHSPHSSLDGEVGAVACVWQIFVAEGARVKLSLNANAGDLCNGQLHIYDGVNSLAPEMQLNCTASGAEHEQTLVSTGSRVLVRYTVGEAENSTMGAIVLPFVLDYETDCNVVLEHIQGVIESPNFPENYPPKMNCLWDVRVGGRTNKISLAFSHFEVEHTGAHNCDYDYVEVSDMRNEEQLSQRRLCTNTPLIVSEGNRLLVRFVSDYSTHAHGFRAEYKRLGCDQHLHTWYGNFASPQAPYSVDVDCDWFIEAPYSKQISFVIQELHIETERSDCSQDVLLISEQKNSTHTLFKSCQVEQHLQTLTSPSNRLYVHYRGSSVRTRKFFRASYMFVDANCGHEQKLSSGVITSPGFYARNGGFDMRANCVWSIEVPNSYGINLHFEAFNLTETAACEDTFVELKKIDGEAEFFLERACGNEQPLISHVNGNRLSLRYQVAENAWGRFKLHYERRCGGALYTADGYIKSRLDEACTWVINGGSQAEVSLSILHLECACASQMNCSRGLKLLDENSNVLLYDFCAKHQTNIIAHTNTLRVVATNVNFSARFDTLQTACGGRITTMRGSLVSPHYPSTYPSNVECVWELPVVPGNVHVLTFEVLNIAKSSNCNEDFLEVRQGDALGQLLGLYCSNELPDEPLLTAEGFWLKFRSVAGSSGIGFKLNWDYAHEIEFNSTSGDIESPPVLLASSESEAYSWRILVQRDNIVTLDFKEYSQGLRLFDGYDETGMEVEINYSPWSYRSSSNVLYLKSVNDDLQSFKLHWHAVSEVVAGANKTSSECHEDILLEYNSVETITSPGYPNGYGTNLRCLWTLRAADPTEHVVIDIYEVKLENTTGCSYDALLISSSSNMQDWHEELRICDSRDANLLPLRTLHGTPNLRMSMLTDQNINGTGFKAVAHTACGSNMTGSVGVIFGSHILRSRTVNLTCLWHIEVPRGKQIDINIEYSEKATQLQNCPHYGLIYDGIDEQAPLIQPGKFCNQANFSVTNFRSKSNHVVVKYIVPNVFGNPLRNIWNLTYREYNECGAEVRLTPYANTVNISSPGYPYIPHPYTVCSWTVIAPPGETITANFVDRFELNLRLCDKEFVELYDGSTSLARQLVRTCTKPDLTRSTGNVLYVRYQADSAEPRGGFRLNVSISTCGGIYTSFNGIFSSEHFPSKGGYAKPAVCDYIIKTPNPSFIFFNFITLSLPYNATAADKDKLDRLEFFALPDMTLKMVTYGNTSEKLPEFQIDAYEVLVRFTSVQLRNDYLGFQLKYKRTSNFCYRNVHGVSGQLIINQNENYSRFSNCNWRITVPKGQRARLRFIDLQHQSEGSSLSNNFMTTLRPQTPLRSYMLYARNRVPFVFYNDEKLQSKITEFNLTNYDESQIIQSTDNFMLAKISFGIPGGIPSWLRTVRAEYTAVEGSPCPPNIDSTESGIIDASALYSIKSFHCSISYTLAPEETISFLVRAYSAWFTSPSGPVSFRDQMNFISDINLSTNMSNGMVSVSERKGKLQLLQNDNAKILRFEASYRRHACGGLLKLEEGFTLSAPDIQQQNYGTLECAWTLRKGNLDTPYTLHGDVSFNDSCAREYVLIYKGSRNLRPERFCRDTTHLNSTVLEQRHAFVIYHVEQYEPGQSSFTLVASKYADGGLIRVDKKPSESIVIDAKHYKNNQETSWEFSTNPGLYLSVVFNGRFFIEDAPNCTNDSLEVQHYQNGIWYSDARFCGRNVPPTVNVTSERMRVIFRTNEAITGDGFSFYVKSVCYLRVNVTSELQTLPSQTRVPRRIGTEKCTYIFESNTKDLITVSVKMQVPRLRTACYFGKFKTYKLNQRGSKLQQDEDEEEQETFIGEYCSDFESSSYQHLRMDYEAFKTQNFIIQYQLNSCGGNFSRPFELRSPQGEAMHRYAAEMNCVWHITAPAEHAIILRFKYMELEDSTDCIFDYISVYKGPVQTLEHRVAHMCGNRTDTPPLLVIDSDQAVIVVGTDPSIELGGFLAMVQFTPNCNERISLSEGNAQVALQRHFNFNGSDVLLCYYRVTAPPGYRVAVELKDLHLNADRKCTPSASCANCNYLEVVDSMSTESSSIGKYCANGRTQARLMSSYEDVLLKLSVLVPGQYNFELDLQMERSACGATEYILEKDQSINISFPAGNLSSYAPSTHCTWTFNISEVVEVHLKRVRLPSVSQVTGKCADYLHIQSLYYYKFFCGSFNDTHLSVPHYLNHNLKLTFHSDEVVEQVGGFELSVTYAKSCNRTYSALSQRINIADFSEHCSFEIRVPADYNLNLYINTFSFGHPDRSDKSMLFIDLNSNRTLLNYTQTHYYDIYRQLTTNAVRFESLNLNYLSMFYMSSNKSLPRGCGGVLFGESGEFTNPSYDDRNYSNCTWDVSVPLANQLVVNFVTFNMGSTVNCPLDYVKVYTTPRDRPPKLVDTYCGNNVPTALTLQDNRVLIVAQKSPNFDGEGFRISFMMDVDYSRFTRLSPTHEFV